jgi:predicted Zn-dependent protease
MAAMFDKLDTANRLNDNGAFPYLRSHPLTVDRIGEARQLSVVDSRLRQLSSTRRQLALEMRGETRRVPGPDEPLPPQDAP